MRASAMHKTSTPSAMTTPSNEGSARHLPGDERLREPVFVEIRKVIAAGRLQAADELIRRAGDSADPAVQWAHAAVAARSNDYSQAEQLLKGALRDDPTFKEAQRTLSTVLIQGRRWEDAIELFTLMLRDDPLEVDAGLWAGWVHAQLGNMKSAINLVKQLFERAPSDARIWLNLGHWYKADGQSEASLNAYRRATQDLATAAHAWWGLANTKRVKFDERSISAMQAVARRFPVGDIPIPLYFALAKGLEDLGRYAEAFAHLDRGSQLYLANQARSPTDFVQIAAEASSCFSPEVIATLGNQGCKSSAPIFIIGMPRSGTTLLEQILDSHSQVEALGELPYMDDIAASIRARGPSLHAAISSLDSHELVKLGERYLASTEAHRRTRKPFFVDKMPSNWLHAGIIHLIFPKAKFIEARWHPLDCCLSNFRHYFPRGHEFTYSLDALGQVYRACLDNSGYFQRLISGSWTVAVHEQFIENPDKAIRSLLQSIGLGPEKGCLRFFENKRPVNTPSAEQVREPISDTSTGRWRNYDQWLDPLRCALGPALYSYPNAPAQVTL